MADDQTYIYVLRLIRPKIVSEEGPTPEELKTLQEHFNHLRGLTKKGTVLHAGRTDPAVGDRGFGIVILKAESEDAARRLMESDPAVKDKVMTAELFPYRIALVGTAWKDIAAE